MSESHGVRQTPNTILYHRKRLRVLTSIGFIASLLAQGCTNDAASIPPDVKVDRALFAGEKIQSIYWSDADSGKVNAKRFRLSNVDAPETGSLKQRGGAKCEAERKLGYEAKAAMIALTRDRDIVVTRVVGLDRYERYIIELSVDGLDLAQQGIKAGILQPWPHNVTKALSDKPNWCT